jgi:hypothetical protein
VSLLIRRQERDPVEPIRAAGTLDLTVHLRDPDVPAKIRPVFGQQRDRQRVIVDVAREAEGHAGATICGKPLRLEELWTAHDPEPRDVWCDRCLAGEAIGDEPDLFGEDEYVPERRVETVKVRGGVL